MKPVGWEHLKAAPLFSERTDVFFKGLVTEGTSMCSGVAGFEIPRSLPFSLSM